MGWNFEFYSQQGCFWRFFQRDSGNRCNVIQIRLYQRFFHGFTVRASGLRSPKRIEVFPSVARKKETSGTQGEALWGTLRKLKKAGKDDTFCLKAEQRAIVEAVVCPKKHVLGVLPTGEYLVFHLLSVVFDFVDAKRPLT